MSVRDHDEMADGKRRLIDAAIRLGGRALPQFPGLRALAREAGLNHNTFYRHFPDMEALLEAAIASFANELRAALTPTRAAASPGQPQSRAVVGQTFDFATRHADAFTLAFRVLHGAPNRARDLIRDLIDTLVGDMATELGARNVFPPGIPADQLRRMLKIDVLHVFALAVEQIESPDRREALLAEAEELLMVLIVGLAALARARR